MTLKKPTKEIKWAEFPSFLPYELILLDPGNGERDDGSVKVLAKPYHPPNHEGTELEIWLPEKPIVKELVKLAQRDRKFNPHGEVYFHFIKDGPRRISIIEICDVKNK